ncbi:MAG: shikimate kinase [Clostridia bacterium]|nr:shikimate kinase [Clostridia bacterium]
MNLILCGMMGCGKTTIGREIAAHSGKICCDTDEKIVEKHGRIADIFARYGEAHFREIETETVRALAQKDDLVIATGGGLVLKEENVELLKKSGKIVYLRAKKETLLIRLQNDGQRPLLQSEKGLSDRLEELLKARAPIYENVADHVVDVDGKTPDEIAAEIIALTEK